MTNPSHRERLEGALARIADPSGEGARACLTVYARRRARRRRGGWTQEVRTPARPLDGRIVTIKDLFDVKGEPTRAGFEDQGQCAARHEGPPAIARLRAAGAVIVAKSNMTEFAFSAMGINPHYGTPGNPADRRRVRAAPHPGRRVSAADGLCDIAIGTDTGAPAASRRISAASSATSRLRAWYPRTAPPALLHPRFHRTAGKDRRRLRQRPCGAVG